MARKSDYRFAKRRKEEARQMRKTEKRNSRRAKRDAAEQDSDRVEQPPPPQEPSTAFPREVMPLSTSAMGGRSRGKCSIKKT